MRRVLLRTRHPSFHSSFDPEVTDHLIFATIMSCASPIPAFLTFSCTLVTIYAHTVLLPVCQGLFGQGRVIFLAAMVAKALHCQDCVCAIRLCWDFSKVITFTHSRSLHIQTQDPSSKSTLASHRGASLRCFHLGPYLLIACLVIRPPGSIDCMKCDDLPTSLVMMLAWVLHSWDLLNWPSKYLNDSRKNHYERWAPCKGNLKAQNACEA